jgi:hypothetical protein
VEFEGALLGFRGVLDQRALVDLGRFVAVKVLVSARARISGESDEPVLASPFGPSSSSSI